MKTIIAAALVIGCCFGEPAFGQERAISMPYQYPVVPGTDEWNQKVLEATPWTLCQLPENLATNLTDKALIETVMTYPMRGSVLAFNSPAEGLQMVRRNFNGLAELLKRPGSASLLKEHYETFTVDRLTAKKITPENLRFLDFHFMTALFLRQEILSKLSAVEKAHIVSKTRSLRREMRSQLSGEASETFGEELIAAMK